METGIVINDDQWQLMHVDILSKLPEEACGLIGGIGEFAKIVIPVTNILHSSVRFRMEPVEQLKAFQLFEEHKIELIGIYHSHPYGPEGLSVTDVSEAYYPDVVHLVWSKNIDGWLCRGFRIIDREVREVRTERR